MSSPGKPVLRVAPCDHAAAKYAVDNWHYSGCLPVGKMVKIGAWEDNRFAGVVIFSRGASPHLGAAYGIGPTSVCELTRVALRSHAWPVTRIVALALKALRKISPELRLVVSFADPEQGHVGGIYQAGNWVFTGRSSDVVEYYIGGKWVHTREALGGAFGGVAKKKKVALDAPKRKAMGKFRYLMPLDEEMKRKIEPLRKPYPKRAGSSSVEHPVSNGEAGGSIPTPALNLSSD